MYNEVRTFGKVETNPLRVVPSPFPLSLCLLLSLSRGTADCYTMAAAHPDKPKLIEDPQGMLFEYVDQDEAEFLYEVSGACECWRMFN